MTIYNAPSYLVPNDLIVLVAPASYTNPDQIEACIQQLQSWGFNVELGQSVFYQSDNYFSAPDSLRLADLQWALDHPTAKAILMTRGGYGMSRIIDDIDLTGFTKYPKWVCGFSDITVLHHHLLKHTHTCVMHAPMTSAYLSIADIGISPHLQSFYNCLIGQPISYQFAQCPNNRLGTCNGPLLGGNLAMVAHLTGSNSALNFENALLFIEDVGEHLYNIDRMLIHLKRSGQLENIAGLMVGGFTNMEDTTRPFGKQLEEIIQHHFENIFVPIAFNVSSGHQEINYPLKFGVNYQLNVNAQGSILTESNLLTKI